MKKIVFIDTDIMLDYLLRREPFFEDALGIMNAGAFGKVKLFISVITIANLIYFLRKKFSTKETQEKLALLRSFIDIASSNNATVDVMINSNFSDLEDGLQYASAVSINADVILTRNKKDYKQSNINLMTAKEFLEVI
jgi:predicted nucleic acid-binding protein